MHVKPRTLRHVHAGLTITWALLAVPTLLLWRESILWLALMSLWANFASHWSAHRPGSGKCPRPSSRPWILRTRNPSSTDRKSCGATHTAPAANLADALRTGGEGSGLQRNRGGGPVKPGLSADRFCGFGRFRVPRDTPTGAFGGGLRRAVARRAVSDR